MLKKDPSPRRFVLYWKKNPKGGLNYGKQQPSPAQWRRSRSARCRSALYPLYGVPDLRGDNDALSLPLTILAVVFIGGLSCLMLFMTWKQWQELKNAPPAEDEDEDEEEDAERGDEQALPPAEEES